VKFDEPQGPIPFKAFRNEDIMNSGVTFNYNLKYFITNSFSITFNNSFKRSLLLFDDDYSKEFGAKPATYVLVIDYQFLVDYHIKLNQNSKMYLRLGYERMNTGSNYSSLTSFYNPDGTVSGKGISTYDFAYFSNNIGLGYIHNKLDIIIGTHLSTNTEFADVQATYYVPYLRLNYTLFKM
jgi:hypothetical protein